MIDTHAHLDFREFDSDRERVIKRAFKKGVEKIINVGCNLEKSKNSVKLAQEYENIYASVGVHPQDGKKEVEKLGIEKVIEELKELAQKPKVVAIGEIGLDYYRIQSEDGVSKEEIKNFQKDFFAHQLRLARKLNLPVILHCRDAYWDMLEILKMLYPSRDSSKLYGVTHCFLGARKIAKELIRLGFLLSFTGAITYQKFNNFIKKAGGDIHSRPHEPEIFKVIKEIPLEKIMLDSDCPYLAPVPHRGSRNEPAFIKHIAEKIAEIKGISFEKVDEATTKNAGALFNL